MRIETWKINYDSIWSSQALQGLGNNVLKKGKSKKYQIKKVIIEIVQYDLLEDVTGLMIPKSRSCEKWSLGNRQWAIVLIVIW